MLSVNAPTHSHKTVIAGLDMLLQMHVLPYGKRVRDPNEFRTSVVYYEDVLDTLHNYVGHLRSIFHRFAGAHRPRFGRALRWTDWSDLMIVALGQSLGEGEDIGYIGGLTERELKLSFSSAKMGFVDELGGTNRRKNVDLHVD